jgi:hypothetical protein
LVEGDDVLTFISSYNNSFINERIDWWVGGGVSGCFRIEVSWSRRDIKLVNPSLSCFSLLVFSDLFEEEEKERVVEGVVVILFVNNNEISISSGYH